MEQYIETKYPARYKSGIRYIADKGSFYEVMFNGGETLYLKYDKWFPGRLYQVLL